MELVHEITSGIVGNLMYSVFAVIVVIVVWQMIVYVGL